MQVIALLSTKGGAGKTALATALAVEMGAVVLDLDPQASACRWRDRREAAFPVVTDVAPARLRPVLVAVPPRGQRADQARRAIQGLGLRVCPHTLGHRTAWGDASALGLTVGEYQPAGSAAAELRRVVEWITLLVAQPQLPEASDVEVRT